MWLGSTLVVFSIALFSVAPGRAAAATGAVPSGPVIALHGAIFGATEYGGPNCPRLSNLDVAGCGTVYEVYPSGGHTVLHAFAGDDGANPSSGVVADRDGVLYGATNAGGTFGHGVVYRIASDGSGFAVLHAFPNGSYHGTLTLGPDGTIYGVAPPSHGDGHGASIFALSRSGDFRTLRVFGPETHIASPLAIDDAGQLYGILIRGGFCGGDVFSMSGTGAYGIVFSNSLPYADPRCAKTTMPTSPLIDDEGSFYATGGATLYSVSKTGIAVVYALPKVEHPIPGPGGRYERLFVDGSSTLSPDGSVVAAVTPTIAPRDCGRILHFDPENGNASIDVLRGDVRCIEAKVARSTPVAMVYLEDSLYDVVDQGVTCSDEPPGPAFCGAVLKLGAKGSQVVAVFDRPDPELAASMEFAPFASAEMSDSRLPNRLSMSMLVMSPEPGPFFVRAGTSSISLHPVGDPNAQPISIAFTQDVWQVNTPGPSSREWVGNLSLGVRAIPAGMYAVDITGFRPIVSDADGYPVDATQSSVAAVYIAPAPSATPVMRRGQRFIEFTQPAGVPPFSMPGLRVRTLTNVEPMASGEDQLTFSVDDGSTDSVDAKSKDVFGLDGLTPIVDDSDVDGLAAKYAGRDVYPIGGFVPVCLFSNGMSGGLGADLNATYHIRSIVRLYGASAMWGIGPWALHDIDSYADYVTSSPILVAFDGKRENGILSDPPYAGHACAVAYAEFSGSWDFERSLSLRSIVASHPEWTGATLDAIERQKIVAGMTRAMVIASLGYPSVYGTASQMMKLDTWDYVMPAPFAYTVHFKGDTVVKYDPPGQLP